MKLVTNSTPVCRASSIRSQPYDLRRRVLVKNFLNVQQSPGKVHNRPPTPRIPHQLRTVQTQPIITSESRIRGKSECKENRHSSGSIRNALDCNEVKNLNNGNSLNESFLVLFSRRLRSSENSSLRQPCRKSKQSTMLRHSKTRLSESQEKLVSRTHSPFKKDMFKAAKSSPTTVHKMRLPNNALRSYPTFDKLNEIVSCDSATYKKTIEALRSGSTRPSFSTPKNVPKLKRSSSIRQSLSKLLKYKSSSKVLYPSLEANKSQLDNNKSSKRCSLVSKLFSPLSSELLNRSKPAEPDTSRLNPITRSFSFRTPPTPAAPKLRRRAQSLRLRVVKLNNDAF